MWMRHRLHGSLLPSSPSLYSSSPSLRSCPAPTPSPLPDPHSPPLPYPRSLPLFLSPLPLPLPLLCRLSGTPASRSTRRSRSVVCSHSLSRARALIRTPMRCRSCSRSAVPVNRRHSTIPRCVVGQLYLHYQSSRGSRPQTARALCGRVLSPIIPD